MLKNKYLWIGVVFGLVVGDIVGVAVFKKVPALLSGADSALVATTSPFYASVSSQPAGSSVMVSEMRSSATSTWLVVREQNGDLLGWILGARRIDATSSRDVEVGLIQPTVPHLMYAVAMYEDDGNRLFEYATDTLIRVDGNPVSYPFVAN